jgi:hypothetical protein
VSSNLVFPEPRIVVIGVTGSGKTMLSARLARIFGVPHIELDALHWQPNWVAMEREAFRDLVAGAVSGPAWVVDGNYLKALDLIWSRATTVVWLDYALPVILWQLTGRTIKRMINREVLWNGNRETFRGAFFSKDSLFLWALQSYPRMRQSYPQLFANPENAHLQVIHLHNPRETALWLGELEKHFKYKNC